MVLAGWNLSSLHGDHIHSWSRVSQLRLQYLTPPEDIFLAKSTRHNWTDFRRLLVLTIFLCASPSIMNQETEIPTTSRCADVSLAVIFSAKSFRKVGGVHGRRQYAFVRKGSCSLREHTIVFSCRVTFTS